MAQTNKRKAKRDKLGAEVHASNSKSEDGRDANVNKTSPPPAAASESGLFVQGACIAGLSVLLTYLGDVVFSNIRTIAGPLVRYQNPILSALLLGLLLHPTADRVHSALSRRAPLAALFDGWCDRSRYGPGRRALAAAIVVWIVLALVSVVLGFLSIGLVLEGASAARDAAALDLPARAEEMWTVYVVDGGVVERYPALGNATEWLRENAADTVRPHVDAVRGDMSRILGAVEQAATEFAAILESHGIETSSLPDPSALISGQASHVKEFVGTVFGIVWTTGKSMVSSPDEALAAIRDVNDQLMDEFIEVKTKVEEKSWVASYTGKLGGDAAGKVMGLIRYFAGAFGSTLAFVWRSFLSSALFVGILFKLLQADRSWLEAAFANFLPGVVPIHAQEQLTRRVQTFSTTLFTSLGVRFCLMYVATYGSWLLFQVPFPYTMSLFFAIVNTITPIGATGRGIITVLCSLRLAYISRDSQSVDSSHWFLQCAHFLSNALVGAIGWFTQDGAEDGILAAYARRFSSPGFIVAASFVFVGTSAQAWADSTAQRFAPDMPWTQYITFGGALLSAASWLATEDIGEDGTTGGECATQADSSSSLVSPWALAASLALFAAARMNPSATRAALLVS